MRIVIICCLLTLIIGLSACKGEDHAKNLIGSYATNETCIATDDYFIIKIMSDSPNKISIENFSRWAESVTAIMNNGEDFIIEKQEIEDFILEGDGTLCGNTIFISYRIRGDNWSEVCKLIAVKK